MKKVFSALVLLLSFQSAHSQYYMNVCDDCYGSIEIGGLISSINGLDDASAKAGFYAGYYQFKPISETFSFRSGVSYNNIGAKIKDYDTPLVIHSINVPLSVHYILKEKYQFFIGGEIGTNFFGKLPIKDVQQTPTSDNFAFHDNFKLIDGSIFFGAGYIFFEHLDLNLKYNVGATNLANSNIIMYKKNWLTLSVGYTFR
ncbi:outer membrane beta-barrel protein [Flavobacterium sp. SUN052]|uniref:outer membrane beta-barrel protein n=1 Tax=Flavobacterium sp. SUN052 TaxID=3002441 RepID=UPI00237D5DCD|nr:outer membrane beta-barrel protein [Flavobacterium sp. SUN052]MEC4004985.1 outer membrane beta-barrel protein [Flavobacterium sp. SUN052]